MVRATRPSPTALERCGIRRSTHSPLLTPAKYLYYTHSTKQTHRASLLPPRNLTPHTSHSKPCTTRTHIPCFVRPTHPTHLFILPLSAGPNMSGAGKRRKRRTLPLSSLIKTPHSSKSLEVELHPPSHHTLIYPLTHSTTVQYPQLPTHSLTLSSSSDLQR